MSMPLSASAFPARVYCLVSSKAFQLEGATIERTACMTRSTELDGEAENGLSVALSAAAMSASTERMA